MNYNEKLILAITKAMKEKKITGKMIEEETGVTQSSISNWKNGYQPKFENAIRVMQYLGIDSSEIMDLTDKSENDMRLFIAQNYAVELRDELKRRTENIHAILSDEVLTPEQKIIKIGYEINNIQCAFNSGFYDTELITGKDIAQYIPYGFKDYTE